MEYSIFDSPNYRKIMKYHPDMESYQELVSEINEAEGEYNSQLEQQDIQLEELEKIKKQVVEDGVDKGLMTTIVGITGKDDLLETRGLSLESFSSYPSRINANVALEEVNELAKGIIIGTALAMAVAMIIKIIKKIYDFFKGRKTSVADTKALQEKVQKKIQDTKMMEEEFKRAVAEVDELRKAYEEVMESAKEREQRVDESIDDACTLLIQKVVKDSATKDLVSRVFSEFGTYTKSIMRFADGAGEINASIDTWIADKTFGENVKRIYDVALEKTPPATMRKNIDELSNSITHLKDLSKETQEPTKEFREKLIEFIQTKRDLGFINNLEQWNTVENSALMSQTNNDKLMKQLEDLKKRAVELDREHKDKVSPDDAKIMKEYIKYFTDVTKVYMNICLLFQEIANSWNRLLRAVDNRYTYIGTIVKNAISKSNIKIESSEYKRYQHLIRYLEEMKGK